MTAREGYTLKLVDDAGVPVPTGAVGELWVLAEGVTGVHRGGAARPSSGENVSSFEVERVINEHPDVYESAVVSVPSALTEDDIKAVVVPQPGRTIDPRELTEFLVDRLPYFMVPRYLDFRPELPKTPTQKVHKHVLRESGATGWDREAAGIVVRRGTR